VICISAVLDRTDAIDNFSGLIEFERHLGQLVQIAVRMRTYQELNLRFGKPNFSCRFQRACYLLSRFLVALVPVQDLLLRAKELFVAAALGGEPTKLDFRFVLFLDHGRGERKPIPQ
jgi:hypothetical protein